MEECSGVNGAIAQVGEKRGETKGKKEKKSIACKMEAKEGKVTYHQSQYCASR